MQQVHVSPRTPLLPAVLIEAAQFSVTSRTGPPTRRLSLLSMMIRRRDKPRKIKLAGASLSSGMPKQ